MNNNLTYFKARQWAFLYIQKNNLNPDVANYLLLAQMHWSNTQLLMHYRDLMPSKQISQYQSNIKKYVNGLPPQYIIGQTSFYGIDLKVNPSVLIPRPETEELVDWILSDHDNKPLNILDVGTGSGAIAIALKKYRPNWNVYASDISSRALLVAKDNIKMNGVSIHLIQSDLFSNLLSKKFDIIVSNPPYISHNEIKYMDKSVLNYEPKQALFAADDGLKIYKKLANENCGMIVKGGFFYGEIGFHQKESIRKIFKKYNPSDHIKIKKDIEGLPRMVKISY